LGAKVRTDGVLGEWIWEHLEYAQNALVKQPDEDRFLSSVQIEGLLGPLNAVSGENFWEPVW